MKTIMHRINLILIFPFLASLLNAAKAPNFVLVYMDDLGWAETSVPMIKGRADTSSDFNQTPNIERLAFQVGVSQNHVDFQDRQLERSTRLIKMHEQRGTADKN
jgi:hypothetical protein